jgi:membrane fusion protein (multidrug efflux system)
MSPVRLIATLALAAALGGLAGPAAGQVSGPDLYAPPPLAGPGQGALGAGPEIRAQISPRRHTVLSAEIPGKIVRLDLREGETFAEGDVLAAIDCAAHEARRDRAAAQEQAARRRLETSSRLDSLSSISRLEVDEARAALAAAEAETALAQVFVSRCEIRAPFAGRVAERRVQPHQYVAEGDELLAILDDGALEVEMLVPSRWLVWLEPGQSFTVAIDELGRTVEAEVARIGARVDPVSQSIKVFGRIPHGTPGLVAGMSGVARLAPPPGDG